MSCNANDVLVDLAIDRALNDEQLNIQTLKDNGYSDEQIAKMDIIQITELTLEILKEQE
jgi:hypothetical protein